MMRARSVKRRAVGVVRCGVREITAMRAHRSDFVIVYPLFV
jgi:hypothetical protein